MILIDFSSWIKDLVDEEQSHFYNLLRIGWIFRANILAGCPSLIRDRKSAVEVFRKCMIGTEMVDWLLAAAAANQIRIHSRSQATAMWQVLLEDGVIHSSK